MASDKPPPELPALNATRQMLDELDALMERMLALPVNDAEPVGSGAPTASATAAEPSTAPAIMTRPLSASLTLLQAPTDERPASFRPTTEAPGATPAFDPAHFGMNPTHLSPLAQPPSEVDETTWGGTPNYSTMPFPAADVPVAELPDLPPAAPAMPEPFPTYVVPPLAQDLDALLAEVPDPPASLATWFILPVLWGNRLFDQTIMLFGESASWLRGPAVRNTLGTAGLILLGAALLWLARDWLGWTW